MSELTPGQVAPQLRRIRNDAPKSMGQAFRRGIARIRATTVKSIRTKGVGRSIWGATDKVGAKVDRNSVRKLFVSGKVKESNYRYSVDLGLKGLPAMMEVGGRTKPHKIEPKNPAALSFLGTNDFGGGRVVAQSVDHPGAPIAADPSLAPAIDKYAPVISTDIDRVTAAAISRITGEAT